MRKGSFGGLIVAKMAVLCKRVSDFPVSGEEGKKLVDRGEI